MKQIDIQTIDNHQIKTYVFDKVKKPIAVLDYSCLQFNSKLFSNQKSKENFKS
ncbi:hypothetical protein [Mycoplasma mycoides]|uniref:hypothetical protein n=1 Tax=Mycoplasma mycoides TaxID=2102 RepID=UPI001019C5DA|nr:hypothetical protein [Mycoplasma mycoides]SRX64037.1 hypothetical protein MMC68H_00295 [Mycoplasma mycoides subsp. capri]